MHLRDTAVLSSKPLRPLPVDGLTFGVGVQKDKVMILRGERK
jgi:hypothetical protein